MLLVHIYIHIYFLQYIFIINVHIGYRPVWYTSSITCGWYTQRGEKTGRIFTKMLVMLKMKLFVLSSYFSCFLFVYLSFSSGFFLVLILVLFSTLEFLPLYFVFFFNCYYLNSS